MTFSRKTPKVVLSRRLMGVAGGREDISRGDGSGANRSRMSSR